jgi:hypothetical protein
MSASVVDEKSSMTARLCWKRSNDSIASPVLIPELFLSDRFGVPNPNFADLPVRTAGTPGPILAGRPAFSFGFSR